jgi:hypothetical protein
MTGTAAPATGYLLIEQPGGWGRQALTSSRLDPAIGSAVSGRAIAAGLRVLLIRKPGRNDPPARRSWAVVRSRPGSERAWWGHFERDEELLALPLDGSAGEPSAEPFFLVCTHGRHDPCCAVEGRPVAARLAELWPGRAWECSHVGGDRFAANVVAMPYGLYYGQVGVADASTLVAAAEAGEVVPRLLRGRSVDPPAAQAAIAHVRELLGEARIDSLRTGGVLHLGGGRWQVRIRRTPRNLMVTVQAGAGPEPGLLTCRASRGTHAPAYDVVAVDELP